MKKEQTNYFTMGGELRREEPKDCKWKEDKDVWRIMEKGHVHHFLQRLHGFDNDVTKAFVEGWDKGMVNLANKSFSLSLELLSKIIGLPLDGLKFSKEIKVRTKAYQKFPETDEERALLVKGKKDYVDIENINNIWGSVIRVIMEYFTLEGRYSKVYNYHFSLANHFRHNITINFPFFLLCSLNQSITEHRVKNFPVLHVRLILLIVDYARDHIPDPIPT
jgi:hypothetical protein